MDGIKKMVVAILLSISLSIIIIAICFNHSNNYYDNICYVREAHNGIISAIDLNGDIWQFKDYTYQYGDYVLLHMDNNGTEEIEDDIIIGYNRV